LTLSWLKANLESRGAKSVEILTVVRKPDATKVDIKPKYVGFDIPNEFVVGYGLDFNERYRNLPFIAVLAKAHVFIGRSNGNQEAPRNQARKESEEVHLRVGARRAEILALGYRL